LFDRLTNKVVWSGRRSFTDWAGFAANRAEVAEATAGLLRNDGIRPLSGRETARIRAYARRVFGSEGYAPWLVFYTLYRGEFVEGWVPGNFFQTVAVQQINGVHHRLDAARTLLARLLGSPSLPDIAHFVSGEWRDVDGNLLDRQEVPAVLFGAADEVCVKAERSFRGRGVSFVARDGFDIAAVEALGSFVVQKVIRQNPAFDAISPDAVATLRVSTGKLPGARPFLIGAYLRAGRRGARFVGLGSLRIPVLDGAGSYGSFASDSAWTRFETHPDTGFRFAGARLPEFERTVAHCLALHDRLPQLGLIGWDVVLDDAGAVQVMEFNAGHPDVKFIEMSVGPSLAAFAMEQYARRRGRPAGSGA
jgi:hypothetical protein